MKNNTEDNSLQQGASNDESTNTFISEIDYQICLSVLQKLIDDPNSVEINHNHNQIFKTSTAFYKAVKKNRKKKEKQTIKFHLKPWNSLIKHQGQKTLKLSNQV